MKESNKEILQRANARITAGDNEGFLAFCTENTKWSFVGDKSLDGKDAVREWMATAYVTPPQFTIENMIEGGDYVTALGTITIKDENGVPADYSYCDVWRFEDGKIAELKAFVIKNMPASE